VSVAYDCWAFRRLGVALDPRDRRDPQWHYRDPSSPVVPMADQAGFTRTGREVVLTAPFSEADIRALKVGDVVLLNGRMFTGRDSVHAHLMKHDPPVDLRGAALYHCGRSRSKTASGGDEGRRADDEHPRGALPGRRHPQVRRAGGDRQGRHGRQDPRGPQGVRRGLPERHRRRGPVLCSLHRARGRRLALRIRRPEALWHLHVKDFPAIVTMDASGNSLHKDVEADSAKGTRGAQGLTRGGTDGRLLRSGQPRGLRR